MRRHVRIALSSGLGTLAILLVSGSSTAQIRFERTYGGDTLDYGRSVQQTDDGGYIVAGITWSFGAGQSDIYLLKTDSTGDTAWTRTYGGSGVDRGHSVLQTQDGGYVLTGYTRSFGAGGTDVYLVKTDSMGDTAWTRTYGGSDSDRGYSVLQTDDGGYIVAGYTWSFGAGQSDIYLLKTDSMGDSVWARTYGGTGGDNGFWVRPTRDGGYIVAGETWSFGAGQFDFYLVKTDSVGKSLWSRTYGGSSDDCGYSVQQTQDGGYILTGYTDSFGAGLWDVYVVKTDSVGDTAWTRTYGGTDLERGYSVLQTDDGGYIVAGFTWSFGAGQSDLYLVKTDSLGDTAWTRTYGGSGGEEGYSVQQTNDGGYVIAGSTSSSGMGFYDAYLVKTGPNGQVRVLEKMPRLGVQHVDLAQNHPNPFCLSTVISYSLPEPAQVTLRVYGITGRLVETPVNERQNPGVHQILWDAEGQPSGVYFYRLEALEFVASRKMVLAR